MQKLISVLILSLMLLLALLLPATVQANGSPCPWTITYTAATLPVTDITNTSAVFHGSYCLTINGFSGPPLPGTVDGFVPAIFHYGATYGGYPPSTVNAEIVTDSCSTPVMPGPSGVGPVTSCCVTFKATVTNLSPCGTYYVQFEFPHNVVAVGGVTGPALPAPCFVFNPASTITFTTPGCQQSGNNFGGGGSGGTGGTGGTGGPEGYSLTPTSAPITMSNIVVQNATVASSKVSPGEQVGITASMTNKGGTNGSYKVTLYVNGQEVESKGVTLASGETQPVYFTYSANEPGSYKVYVNNVSAGILQVDVFTNNDMLIYSIMAMFVAGIIGVLYLIVRKRAV